MKGWCKNLDCLQYVSLSMLLAVVFLTYTNRVDDLDLWWHLKTGEVVVKNHSLPKSDPFSYTTGTAVTLSDRDLQELGNLKKPTGIKNLDSSLSHSWLGQVFLYLAFALGGFFGVGLLKTLVFMVTFSVLYWAMRYKGAGSSSSLLVLFLVALIGRDFAYSRPQIFTFMLLAVSLYLFVDFRRGGRKIMALPAVFLVWSNIHGGFVVGAILLLIFWCSEAGKYFLHEKFKFFGRCASSAESIRRLSYSSLLSMFAMLCNPNQYKVLLLAFAAPSVPIEEYVRPMLYEYHAYWFMLALVLLLVVILLRVNDPTDLLFVAFLVTLSQLGIRGIILFAIGAAPFLAVSITRLWQWLCRRRYVEDFFGKPGLASFAAYRPQQFVFLVFLLFFGINQARAEGVMKFSINADNYPGRAVAFLQGKDFPGRLFNPYNWGGYLIWQYPQRQVFVDGRGLDEQAFFHYQLIAAGQGGLVSFAPGSRLPLWKRLLDEYGIQVILTNAVTSVGRIVPLVDMLAFDPDWTLVYQDGTSLVFLRDSPGNRDKFGGVFLDKKSRIFDEIVSESLRGSAEYPATKGYYELLGGIYSSRKELGKAREMYEKYLRIDRNNVEIVNNLNVMRQMNGEAPLPVPQQQKSPHSW